MCRFFRGRAPLVTLLCVLSCSTVLSSTPYVVSPEWYNGLSSKGPEGCVVAPAPKYQDPPTCPQVNTTLSASDIQKLGYLLAPRVYMHPMEWSFLADPQTWLRDTPLYDRQYNAHNISELQALYNANPFRFSFVDGPLYFASRLFDGNFSAKVSTKDLIDKLYGDPIVNGTSTAKIWFTATDPRPTSNKTNSTQTTVQFTYHLYYPWNGCSNQNLALHIQGANQGLEYYMCPAGVHEGDWERVSFFTCVSDLLPLVNNTELQANATSVIRRAQYAQHGWWAEYDCLVPGECPVETGADNVSRSVVYSGLFSHASYREATPLQLYKKVNIKGILANFDGIYIGDRTSRDGAVFNPTPDNIRWLPTTTSLVPDDEDYASLWWALFPGSWGGFYVTTPKEMGFECFFHNLTAQGPCNDTNPAYFFLKGAVSVLFDVLDVDSISWTADLTQVTLGKTLTGPLLRNYTYGWAMELPPPLYTGSGNDSCPFSSGGDGNSSWDEWGGYTFTDSPSLGAFIGILLGLLIGAGLVFSIMLVYPGVGTEALVSDEWAAMLPKGESTPDMGPPEQQGISEPPALAVIDCENPAFAGAGELALSSSVTTAAAAAVHATATVAPATATVALAVAVGPATAGPVAEGLEGNLGGSAKGSIQQPGLKEEETTTGGARGGKREAFRALLRAPVTWYGMCRKGGQSQQQEEDGCNGIKVPRHSVLLASPTLKAGESKTTFNSARQVTWMTVAMCIYIAGLALTCIGIQAMFEALRQIYDTGLWDSLQSAFIAITVLFGLWQVIIIVLFIVVRGHDEVILCGPFRFRNKCASWRHVDRCGFITHGHLSGLLVIEINTTVLLFSVGFMMWVMRYLIRLGCNTVFDTLFTLTSNILADVCLNLTNLGLPNKQFCGADLAKVCTLWDGLNVEYLVFGSYLFILAHLMFLAITVKSAYLLRLRHAAQYSALPQQPSPPK